MVMALVGGAVVFVDFGWLAVALEGGDLEVAGFVAAGFRFHGAFVEDLGGVFLLLVV